MNQDIIIGNWKQVVGKVKEKWGKLTDDEIAQINGQREILVGKLQEKYGFTKEDAEDNVKKFFNKPYEEEEEE